MYASWVEVSRSALLYNVKQYQRLIGSNASVLPVIKSNAYGHGMLGVAKILAPKVRWLGVVNLAEALELRRVGIKKKILVLSYAQPELLGQGITQDVSLPVYTEAFARQISKMARSVGRVARLHIKIDTGTSRVGFLPGEVAGVIKRIDQLPNIAIEGVWSHFASSEENQSFTSQQLKKFSQVLARLEKEGIEIPFKHFACSAAMVTTPAAYFNLARLGLSLYGLWPSKKVELIARHRYPWLSLKPALAWKTKIIQIKDVPAGSKISYGGTATVKKKTKLAVLAVGYWEGFDRRLSSRGQVLIGGRRCPVLGRICMNLTMVDVSKVKNVKAGDEVVLVGQQACPPLPSGLRRGRGVVTADELAEKIGTINYEVVTRINPLLSRVYVK